jgi:chorismate synthase
MPITSTVSIKPTPSIARSQRTVNLREMKETDIKVGGRHDPCIVPRAVPVVEAMMAFVLADHALRAGVIPRVMGEGQ